MNLKLKRVVRTPYSEEIALFDGDTRDENGAAVNIGKLEVHYLEDQISGTLLLWQEFVQGYNATHAPGSDETLDDLIDAILSELTEPIGVPAEYGIEVYYPSVSNQTFISNYVDEEMESVGEEAVENGEGIESEGEEAEPGQDDEYYRRLARS